MIKRVSKEKCLVFQSLTITDIYLSLLNTKCDWADGQNASNRFLLWNTLNVSETKFLEIFLVSTIDILKASTL